jgi:hypothetical protein
MDAAQRLLNQVGQNIIETLKDAVIIKINTT